MTSAPAEPGDPPPSTAAPGAVHPAWGSAPWWLRILVAGAPAVAFGVATLLAAGRSPVFRDEAATRQLATLGWSPLWRATEHVDRALLPHLVLAKGWVAIAGDGTLALRVPSLVAGVLLVAALGWCAGRWSGLVGAAATGLALGATPLTGSLAVFVRPYALTALASVLAVLCLDLAIDPARPAGSRRLASWGYVVAFGCAVLLHPFAVAGALAQLALVLTGPRPRPVRLLTTGLGAGVVIAFGGWLVSRSQDGQVGWIAPLAAGEVGRLVVQSVSSPVAWLATLGAALGAVAVAAGRGRAWWPVGVALTAGPVLLLGTVSLMGQPSFVGRYLFLVPTGAALLCGGLAGAAGDLAASSIDRVEALGRHAGVLVTSAVLLALAVTSVLVAAEADIRPPGPPGRQVAWSANPASPLADAVADRLSPGALLVVEQRVGWGGYAGQLADAWHDESMAAALDERVVSGALDDVSRTVVATDPVRTETGVDGTAGPTRVVLLSLRSTALDRYLTRTRSAGCREVGAIREPDLGDTRLWLIDCERAPDRTDLSSVADAPSALDGTPIRPASAASGAGTRDR